MIHFKIFETVNEDLLKSINNIIKKSSLYVFQLPEWIDVVTSNPNNFDKLKIVFIFNDNDIILVAPLCIRTVHRCKELCWISSEIIDYNNIIISDLFDYEDNSIKTLWKKIIKDLSNECDLVFLDKNPEFVASRLNPLINSHYKFYQKSYQLNLNKFDYNNFYNIKNNSKSKQTDRRKEKKLNYDNDLTYSYEVVNSTNFQLVQELIYEKMFFYQSKKEKTFNYENIVNQYKELIDSNNSNYKFYLSTLKKKNKKISSILGVIFGGVYYYLIPLVHRSEFKKLSPGRFHIMSLIKWSISNNIKYIDFTAGDEPYKYNWSNKEFRMFYYIKPLSLKGIPRFILLSLYYKLRKNFFLKKIYNYIKYEI